MDGLAWESGDGEHQRWENLRGGDQRTYLKKYGADCISFHALDKNNIDSTSKDQVTQFNALVEKRNEASKCYNEAAPLIEKHNSLGLEFIQK